MKLKDWIPISISVVALGFSVFIWWSAQNEAERTREREYLVDFLRPLKSILYITRDMHQSLLSDTNLKKLEYAPDYVHRELHKDMKPDDPRRVLWRVEIARLMNENEKAVELVERHIGRVENTELRNLLEKFKMHALDWQEMWRAILNPDPELVSGYTGRDRLKTDPFPAGLDELLDSEIARVEALIGLE
ncbi:MAG TPA: hypothetical protein DIU00_11095 [Phycisphaerales bacterium]|nr:hypothetical protein [Phycisphaerales bacterium]